MTNTDLFTTTRAALETGIRSKKGKLKFNFVFENDMAGTCVMSRPSIGWNTTGSFKLIESIKPNSLILDLYTPGFNWGTSEVSQGVGIDFDKFQALISQVEDMVIG